jgi:hypothetical protein
VAKDEVGWIEVMRQMAYVVYREDEFMVAQCLNVDVSSFGSTREAAVGLIFPAALPSPRFLPETG